MKTKNKWFFTLGLACILLIGLFPANTQAATLDCASSTTLEQLYDCIKSHMPWSGEGYTKPTSQQLTDLRTVMGLMLDGQTSITLPASISGIMEFKRFTDTGSGGTYSVLMEVADSNNDGLIDRGFGTFIVYNEADKELNIASAHPYYDLNTGEECIRIFKYTSSRAFSVNGTHRNASGTTSSCQSSYKISDGAHNKDNMFFGATQELVDYYGSATWYQLQFHGMANDSCSCDVNMSHGEHNDTLPGDDILYTFRTNVLNYNSNWDVDVDGETNCTLDGGSNTSGRLISGVSASQVCNTAPSSRSEQFIHIEQIRKCRTADDWIDAVNDTFTPENPPTTPTGLTADTVNCNRIDLSWTDNADNETGFSIERSANGTSFTEITTVGANVTSHSDTTAAEDTTYWYRVSAYNGAGYSDYSNASSDSTPVCPPPAAPASLTATAGNGQVDLDWADNTEPDLASYNVKRATTTGGPYTHIANVTTSNYIDTGVSNGITYYYVVTAVNTGSSESGNSNEASATPTDTAPAAPTSLAATAGVGQVDLDWADNSEPDLASYNVKRATATGGPYTQVVNVTASNYTDTGVTNGTTYYYVVTAVDTGSNESGNSNEASATPVEASPPAAPTNLTATAPNEAIVLNWDDNSSDEDGFKIYRGTSSSNLTLYTTVGANTTSYQDNGATSGTYYYKVCAYNDGGESCSNIAQGSGQG